MRALRAAPALAAFCLSQAFAQSPLPPELEQMPDRFVEYFRQGNLEGIVGLFAPDASYIAIAGPALLEGHHGVRGYYQKIFAGSKSRDITALSYRWQMLDDIAIRSADVMIDQQLADGTAMDTRARITFVYRRDGAAWRIVHHHGSQQPAPPKPQAPVPFGQCGPS